ncbi:MAG: ATP-binding protein [Paraclostridium sp.]
MREYKIKEILTSYERKRDLAEKELDARKKKVYYRIPEVKEIDDEVSKIGLKLAKLVLLNPKDKDIILQETQIEMEKLKKRKTQLLNDFKVPEGYLSLNYDCSMCKDTGFLKNGKKCNCLKQQIINNAYNMSNLSRVLNTQNFSTFDPTKFAIERDDQVGISPQENILEILSICEGFVMNFDKDNDENMLFYGDTGLGKSFMSNCIAKELLDKGYVVIYQTAFKMFEIIEDYKFKNADDHISKDNYENLFDCDLLIIDDLGTELTNSFTNSELFNILNTRLLSGKKTIISTNLSPIQLGEIYTQRIFSRVFDRFRMIKFIGNDLRWDKNN